MPNGDLPGEIISLGRTHDYMASAGKLIQLMRERNFAGADHLVSTFHGKERDKLLMALAKLSARFAEESRPARKYLESRFGEPR
jgi:hypothetical protein